MADFIRDCGENSDLYPDVIKLFFSACISLNSKSFIMDAGWRCFRLCGGQWISHSEWIRIRRTGRHRRLGGLWRLLVVLFGIAAWLVLVCIENVYIIIVALYIYCELWVPALLFFHFKRWALLSFLSNLLSI